MKKLALILAVVFTMGLTASSVSAATKEKAPKKTEQKAADKKDCPAEAKAACGEKKACCDKKK